MMRGVGVSCGKDKQLTQPIALATPDSTYYYVTYDHLAANLSTLSKASVKLVLELSHRT